MTGEKIGQEEMVAMFGEAMPTEAWQLLTDAPPEWTISQVRERLREIAAERVPLMNATRRRDEFKRQVIDWMDAEGSLGRFRTNGQAPMWGDYVAAEDEVARLSDSGSHAKHRDTK